MLKGIPSIVPPELLKILMEMGHGDEIVIGDGNFPAAAYAEPPGTLRRTRCRTDPGCNPLAHAAGPVRGAAGGAHAGGAG